MRIVFSKCALLFLSAVDRVQLSFSTIIFFVPLFSIGSIAITIPGTSFGPVFGLPKFGMYGSSCMYFPTPCPERTSIIPYL